MPPPQALEGKATKQIRLFLTFAFFIALSIPVFADQAPEEVLKAVVKIRALILKVNGKAVEGLADFYALSSLILP